MSDPPLEHVAGISGQWQIAVGVTVVETVVGVGHQCSPGRVVSREIRAAEVQVAQLLQPGLFQMSIVAVQAFGSTTVDVTGGLGVGPVGSPAEHAEVGGMQTRRH